LNHSYVRNVLHIKLLKLVTVSLKIRLPPAGFVIPNPAKSGSGRIGKKSGTASVEMKVIATVHCSREQTVAAITLD